MSSTPRPHTTPPELAKDILGKLDNARVMIERARAVAQRAGFANSDELLAKAETEFEQIIAEVESAVRADTRRQLTGGH